MTTNTKQTVEKPKTTEKSVEDKTQVTQQVVLKPWQKIDKDGNIYDDPTLLQQEQQEQANLRGAYGVDANGRYNGTLGDLFGFDPERYKQEQEAKERLERFKQKEAGWKNALGVISDIVSAGVGGNVWERQPDNVAANANAKAEGYEENVRKMAQAIPQVIAAREKAYRDAEVKRLQDKIAAQGIKVNIQQTQGGGYKKKETGGTKTVTTNNSSNDGGGGSSSYARINVPTKTKGQYSTFTLNKSDYDALSNLLTGIYQNSPDIIDALFENEIDINADKTSDKKDAISRLLQKGILFETDNGEVEQAIRLYLDKTDMTKEQKQSFLNNMQLLKVVKEDTPVEQPKWYEFRKKRQLKQNTMPGVTSDEEAAKKSAKNAPYLS